MKLIQKIIANFKTHVIRKFNNYGYNIIKIHDIDIKIFATNYNVLKIKNGMGGVAYSN